MDRVAPRGYPALSAALPTWPASWAIGLEDHTTAGTDSHSQHTTQARGEGSACAPPLPASFAAGCALFDTLNSHFVVLGHLAGALMGLQPCLLQTPTAASPWPPAPTRRSPQPDCPRHSPVSSCSPRPPEQHAAGPAAAAGAAAGPAAERPVAAADRVQAPSGAAQGAPPAAEAGPGGYETRSAAQNSVPQRRPALGLCAPGAARRRPGALRLAPLHAHPGSCFAAFVGCKSWPLANWHTPNTR